MLPYEGLLPNLRSGMKLYFEEGVKPGSFLQSVLKNQLVGSFYRFSGTPDELFQVVSWVYNYLPMDCWGSKEKFEGWMKNGGQNGRQERDAERG